MRSIVFCAACIICIASFGKADETVRTWTNTDGKTINASLLSKEGDQVTLRMTNGRQYTISLSTLSEADHEYAAAWEAKQAAAAQGEAWGLELSAPAEAIVETAFSTDTPPTRKGEVEGWKAGIGEWRIEEGILIGDEVAEDDHASSLTYQFEASHLIIRAEVRLGTATEVAIACRDTVPPSLHLGRLYITPEKLWIQKMTGIAGTTKAERLVTEEVEIDPEEWYDVTIEIIGDTYRALVGDHEIEATHERFLDAKAIIALVNRGQGAQFRNVSLWHGSPKE
ncbi:MAG: hypothetical protein AAGA96_04275 [Verrucomicrobiota bacterium]